MYPRPLLFAPALRLSGQIGSDYRNVSLWEGGWAFRPLEVACSCKIVVGMAEGVLGAGLRFPSREILYLGELCGAGVDGKWEYEYSIRNY